MGLFSNIWFMLIILPFAIGFLLQLLLGRKFRWLLPAGLTALAVSAALYASTIPIPGSEGPGLRAIQLGCLAIGAILAALIFPKRYH